MTEAVVQEMECKIVTLEEHLSSYIEKLSEIRQNSMINTDKNPRNTTKVAQNDQKSIHDNHEGKSRGERRVYAATIVNNLDL